MTTDNLNLLLGQIDDDVKTALGRANQSHDHGPTVTELLMAAQVRATLAVAAAVKGAALL